MRNPFATLDPRSLFSVPARAAGRPDLLRRQALFINTIIMLVAAACVYPLALYFLVMGSALMVLVASAALVLSVAALVFHTRKMFEAELACHAIAMTGLGMVLSLSDPAIFDFGTAIVLMAALYTLLTSQSRFRQLAWTLPAIALLVSVLSAGTSFGNALASEVHDALYMAAIGYFAAILIIAVTANRLNFTAAAAARSQMKTFDLLVESFKDAVVRYGADGAVTMLSRSASQLLGCKPFELDNGGLLERIHVLDRPAYLAALSDAGRGGLHRAVEIRMRRDDPNPGARSGFVWVEVSLSPVVDIPGTKGEWEVIGILRDISARKDTESEIRSAREDAEQASEAKSRFLATIGHELRTPLNAIVGFSDMMQADIGGELSPTHKEYARLISQSGHHLLEVVNMLLDMSRIEAGKFEINADLFDPAGLVEPCVQIVDSAAKDRNIAIEAVLPRSLPQIVADERACRQILINLLSNATKFSTDGSRIELSMRRQGKMLNISVRDTGIGMGPDTLARIGEPFLQAQDGLSRNYEGTGLGLSIVKGLVSLHDGQLHVTSELGSGTTITILLPIDGPVRDGQEQSANVQTLHPPKTSDDETQWLEDERKSAAR